MTQEQIGLTGSIVIHKRDEPKMNEEVLVLNDWTDIKPRRSMEAAQKADRLFCHSKKISAKLW